MPHINLQVYYMLDVNNNGQLLNFSGCGNLNVFLGSFLTPFCYRFKLLHIYKKWTITFFLISLDYFHTPFWMHPIFPYCVVCVLFSASKCTVANSIMLSCVCFEGELLCWITFYITVVLKGWYACLWNLFRKI